MESELAYSATGTRFALPEHIVSWQVRRMRQKGERGGPDVVYRQEGTPLILPIAATVSDLRDAVQNTPGRYRLDPLKSDGLHDTAVGWAYVELSAPPRNSGAASVADYEPIAIDGPPPTSEREAMRLCIRLAESVVNRFAEVMSSHASVANANANLLRAADGAGLPSREPYYYEPPAPLPLAPVPAGDPQNPLMTILASLASNPALITYFASRAPSLPEAMDWRRAYAAGQLESGPVDATSQSANLRNAAPQNGNQPGAPRAPTVTPVAPVDPQTRIVEVLARLTPAERDQAQAIALGLTPDQRNGWLAELIALDIDQAVIRVRAQLVAIRQEAA